MSFLREGYPSDWFLVPSCGTSVLAGGYPGPRWGTPLLGTPHNQVRMGTPMTRSGWVPTPLARSGRSSPWLGWGTPPRIGYAWTGYAVGGAPLAVSHRRTLLLLDTNQERSLQGMVTFSQVSVCLQGQQAKVHPVLVIRGGRGGVREEVWYPDQTRFVLAW